MNIYKVSDLLNDEIEETKRIRNQHFESDNKTGVLYWTARVTALEKFSARLDKELDGEYLDSLDPFI